MLSGFGHFKTVAQKEWPFVIGLGRDGACQMSAVCKKGEAQGVHMAADSALLKRTSQSHLREGILGAGTELCHWEIHTCVPDVSEGRIEKPEPRHVGRMERDKTAKPLL